MRVTKDNDTLLVLAGIGIPRWSARGLTETLTPIAASQQVTRDINGRALDFAHPQFRKYALRISCTDQRVLAFDGVWPGAEVEIDCVTELAYPLYASPGREVVEDSERQEGDFIFYRPRLYCVFLGFNTSTPEWEGRAGWEADFEEI